LKVSDYLGKEFNLNAYVDYYWEVGEYDRAFYADVKDNHSAAEVYLTDWTEDYSERVGYNAFSLLVLLEENKVVQVLRIGHWHEQEEGCDSKVTRFSRSLEQEADEEMNRLTI